MKLSLKFFCIAYSIVLLSAGFSGILLVTNMKNTLVDSQITQINTTMKYAADSFLSFAETALGEITPSQTKNIVSQIENSFGNSMIGINIISSDHANHEYLQLKSNEGFSRFTREGSILMMESICRLEVRNSSYFLILHSDFSDIEKNCNYLWLVYGGVIFSLAFISGLVLYLLTKKITTPLDQLAKAANNIAAGNYKEPILVKNNDLEILELSKSFRCMSLTIEKKIKEIEEELEKRDMFVSNFTHEIKTPMTAIIGYSQMLYSCELDEAEKRQATEAIYHEGVRLEKLSMQLLDLYLFKNEETPLTPVCLTDIAKQLKDTLKFLSEKYKVSFSVNFHHQSVTANKNMLLSLLYDLTDNAFKASSPDGEVRIFSSLEGEFIRIYVKDNGNGIAPENIKYLTEPFYREDKSRSRELGGAGLGLSLCQKIAEIHGTSLVFDSKKGIGTTVSFGLKLGGEKNEKS